MVKVLSNDRVISSSIKESAKEKKSSDNKSR